MKLKLRMWLLKRLRLIIALLSDDITSELSFHATKHGLVITMPYPVVALEMSWESVRPLGIQLWQTAKAHEPRPDFKQRAWLN